MRFSDVVDALSNESHFPIKPDRLASIIQPHTELERIVFIGIKVDPEILRGKFVRIRYENVAVSNSIPRPYSIPDNKLVAKIYYSILQDESWQRLAVNKELLHIIDPDHVRTCTAADARALVAHLRLPLELMLTTSGNGFNEQAFIDFVSDFRAIIAMVPSSLRTLICEKYNQKKITEQEISDLVGVPLRYVPAILSDRWERLTQLWMTLPY